MTGEPDPEVCGCKDIRTPQLCEDMLNGYICTRPKDHAGEHTACARGLRSDAPVKHRIRVWNTPAKKLPWWRTDEWGFPIETYKGRPIRSAIRILIQNIRKITG